MEFETILFGIEDGIAKITLNRPEVLNCFNEVMHEEIRTAFAAIEADAQVRVLQLTGAGRAFSSGQDLAVHADTMNQGDVVDPRPSLDRDFNPLVKAIQELEIPVVAAVNGVAAGAAANVALACDFVIAARSAKFIQAFTRIGLVPDSGGTFFLPRLVGLARARGLLMLGSSLTADEAAQWGLIWKCVEDEVFEEETANFVQSLATRPTAAIGMTKRALNVTFDNTLNEQLNLERDLQIAACRSEDFHEGVAAFIGKRSANFVGR